MYHIIVIYADQSFREYSHINKIEFYEESAYKTLEGNAISTHRYELGNLTYYLFSENSSASVTVQNAISFEVSKED